MRRSWCINKFIQNLQANLFVVFLLGQSLLCGCTEGDGPALGNVVGKVTLDGQPLSGATVIFSPKAGGRSSAGMTDESGKFTLAYTGSQNGALVGEHNVRVTTNLEGTSAPVNRIKPIDSTPGEGEAEANANPQNPEESSKEKVPQKYFQTGAIVKDVKAGANDIEIELTSKSI